MHYRLIESFAQIVSHVLSNLNCSSRGAKVKNMNAFIHSEMASEQNHLHPRNNPMPPHYAFAYFPGDKPCITHLDVSGLSPLALLLGSICARGASLVPSSSQHGIQQLGVRSIYLLRSRLDLLGVLFANSRHRCSQELLEWLRDKTTSLVEP